MCRYNYKKYIIHARKYRVQAVACLYQLSHSYIHLKPIMLMCGMLIKYDKHNTKLSYDTQTLNINFTASYQLSD